MDECEKLIEKCDILLNCQRRGETPSSGMKKDMEIARAKDKPMKYIEDILGYYPDIDSIMISSGLAEFVTVLVHPNLEPAISARTHT